MRRSKRLSLLFAAVAVLLIAPAVMADWDDCDGWERDSDWGRKGRYCEIREMELAALPSLTVDAEQNGGIRVEGWDRKEIHVVARITVWDVSEADALETIKGIEIVEDGAELRAEASQRDNFSVSYRISAPHNTDLDLEAHNGGVSVAEIVGRLRIETHNGGLNLSALGGDVQARTTNGGVDVRLVGDTWQGEGLDVVTRNGGVEVDIPENYSAELETGTVNGRVSIDFPVTVQGDLRSNISTTLGSGGPTISVRTTNGSVRVRGD